MFPDPPSFTQNQLDEFTKSNDFRPMLFEWYKYVGIVCNIIASISEESEDYKSIPEIHHAILIGLLNRCSRLVLANIALTHKGLYGETFQILQRSIFESSTKLIWLCYQNDNESFNRFLADGMKSDIELLEYVNNQISKRDGKVQVIEKRMITSINDVIEKTCLSVEEIKACKKLPTLSDMLKDIELKNDRLNYIVDQKIGSHSIHGTWTNLVKYYLSYENNKYVLRDHNVEVQEVQFVASSFHVLNSLISYLEYVFKEGELRQNMVGLMFDIREEIINIHKKNGKHDFSLI